MRSVTGLKSLKRAPVYREARAAAYTYAVASVSM